MKAYSPYERFEEVLVAKGQEVNEPNMAMAIPFNRLPHCLERLAEKHPQPYSLLALAKLYGRLRGNPRIWQVMVYELMYSKGYDTNRIAMDIGVSNRTIKRILDQETSNPSINTSFRLFFLHTRICAERYHEVGQDRLELIEH